MITRLVAWVLNSYIGDYFDNVNTDQLSIALHQGEVELEKLPLKTNPFRKWNLPFEIKFGFVGKIRLKIPIYHISSNPWLISLEELYLLAGPITNFDYNEEEEKKLLHEYKMNLLSSMESKFQTLFEANENGSYYASSYSSWFSYGSSLVSSIIENLQLTIRNVHIRYEDSTSISRTTFACGIIIDEISAQANDNSWNDEVDFDEKENVPRKFLSLNGFSIYWDPNISLHNVQLDDMFQMRILSQREGNKSNGLHKYLLDSVDGKAMMIKFMECMDYSHLKFYFGLQLNNFSLKLTLVQYRQMVEWMDVIYRTKRLWKYRKWRPKVGVKGNVSMWWKYAFNAILVNFRSTHKPKIWPFLVSRVKDIIAYCDIYYSYLLDFESLTKEMEEIKERLEFELNYDEISALRETVFNKIRKNKAKVSLRSKNEGYWGWFSGWYSESNEKEEIEEILENSLEDIPISHDLVNAAFDLQVPQLKLQLINIESGMEHDLAVLKMEEFKLKFKKYREFESEIEITLKSLLVEDLCDANSSQRYLMFSNVDNVDQSRKDSPPLKYNFLSTSCPSSPKQTIFSHISSYSSLPSKLQKVNIYNMMPYSYFKKPRFKTDINSDKNAKLETSNTFTHCRSCPGTPPPSYSEREEIDNLVKICILLVGESSPNFSTLYDRNHRIINIEFNTLETIINPVTWEKIFNFFSKKSLKQNFNNELSSIKLLNINEAIDNDTFSEERAFVPKIYLHTKVDLTVRRLSIVLSKPNKDILAKADISGFSCLYLQKDHNSTCEGKLKSLSILDLSKYGKLYTERFITSGDFALLFSFFKFGDIDRNMKREYDMSLNIEMSVVQYIHSQRFYTEIVNFLKNLSQFKVNIRALSAQETINYFTKALRIRLNVEAAAPVIVIPVNYLCEQVLVADFGHLKVRNKFLFAGSPGTIATVCKKSGVLQSDFIAASTLARKGVVTRVTSYLGDTVNNKKLNLTPCLLDVIDVQLTKMHLYPATIIKKDSISLSTNNSFQDYELEFSSFFVVRQPGHILKERFELQLQIERNLDAELEHFFPDISMMGKVSAVHCTIDSSLYQLLRGILENNLGEPLDHLIPTPHIIECEGLNAISSTRIWTSSAIHIDLKNVTLELIGHSNIENDTIGNLNVISRIDFLSSRLSIENYTDSSKDVVLVSQEIRITDSRYENYPVNKRPNVFPDILQPAKKGLTTTPLQLEINYRNKRNHIGLTILLNNMRVMAIFDWFKEMSDFLSQNINFQHTWCDADTYNTATLIQNGDHILPDFDLKFNITDTELVVVENSSVVDTNAVILKGTAILSLATDIKHPEPFNCTLQGVEVFSCILGVEEETALSIVDPLNISIDLSHQLIPHSSIYKNQQEQMVLLFGIDTINLRLSYNDMFLFSQIINSLPRQTKVLSNNNFASKSASIKTDEIVYALPSHVDELQKMGFNQKDCIEALEVCQGSINEAAIILTQNACSQSTEIKDRTKIKSGFEKFNFNIINIQIEAGILCIIDDCKDIDIPLFEIGFSKINLWQRINHDIFGTASISMTCDYFNRALSGWCPIIENWQYDISWALERNNHGLLKKFSVEVNSQNILNIVITNTCLDLFKNVIKVWTDDYNRLSNQMNRPLIRHRSPFVPFAIKNETGCDLKFYMVTSDFCNHFTPQTKFQIRPLDKFMIHKKIKIEEAKSNLLSSDWILVKSNEIYPFSFDGPAKIRHQDSHRLESHKIVVKLNGWHSVFPVSVKKVGKYFREAKPETFAVEPTRIVFDISLENNGRKMITVRSAIMIFNGTPNVMQVKFKEEDTELLLPSQANIPLPLNLTRSKLFVKPVGLKNTFSESLITWEHVKRPLETFSDLLVCNPEHSKINLKSTPNYQFVCIVLRENYPLDNINALGLRASRILAGHQISLVPPLQLVNSLPFELKYRLLNVDGIEGSIKPGKVEPVQYIGTDKEFRLIFSMENYPKCIPLIINLGFSNDFLMQLDFFDKLGRPLNLFAQISLVTNSKHAILVNIISNYWFVNRTGLPLVFKQEAAEKEASGQFKEHEEARNIMPLLFSFYDSDASMACLARLGKSLGKAEWCSSFYLQKATIVRKLRITSNDPDKPNKVFEIGIESRNGRGRYRDTLIVTFTPRYQIENSTPFRLEITQRFETMIKSELQDNVLSVLPNSNVAFHWPRSDQEKLLCVRIASLPQCHWSGGFPVDKNSSLHLNIRDIQGIPHFVRVEILSQGATSFIVFSEATNLPPPIRIDNFSEIKIKFCQMNASQDWMKTTVFPKSSFPYAWDEPTLKPLLTVSVPGGCSEIYDLDSTRHNKNLSYENFFYIAFTGTFLSVESEDSEFPVKTGTSRDIEYLQLVLDVPEGSKKVILNRKELGKRSQLWRMDRCGRLLHEGSSPPMDSRKISNQTIRNNFVLDISDDIPHKCSLLMLRKIDDKRALTQRWSFTPEGRLTCQLPSLYVQPRGGFLGLNSGNEAILGLTQQVTYSKLASGIPFEQGISTQKMRKGSGILSVCIVTDGPTRVLQVLDVRNISAHKNYSSSNALQSQNEKCQSKSNTSNYEVNILFKPDYLGVSLVNQYNEEILYFFMQNVLIEYQYKLIEHKLNCSIRYMQADNQLREAVKPIVMQTMELEQNNPMYGLPALSIFIHKLISPQVRAHFFEDVQITMKDIRLNLEEVLLLKFYEFLGYPKVDSETELIDNKENENVHKAITSALTKSPRIYFSLLQIKLDNVNLSVISTSHLSSKLNQIKKKLRLRLISFEGANLSLQPFRKNYSLETFQFLFDAIVAHYKEQLTGQYKKILGSVYFLGNIAGFASDVKNGFSGLHHGDFNALFTNLAHGISDSTAKVTSVISDALGVVTMDQRHLEIRNRIKLEDNHLKAGFKGLSVGLLGGLTSILTQTYEGAVNEGGIQGVLGGFGRGVLGAITKPAIGMLDLATNTALVVRDGSRKASSDSLDKRLRYPRQRFSVHGVGSLLPKYSEEQAMGQEIFYRSTIVDHKEDDEIFLSHLMLRSDVVVFITNLKLHFLDWSESESERGRSQLSINWEHFIRCETDTHCISSKNSQIGYYIVLVIVDESCAKGSGNYRIFGELGSKRPKILCKTEKIAIKASQEINYAKSSYEESNFTLTCSST